MNTDQNKELLYDLTVELNALTEWLNNVTFAYLADNRAEVDAARRRASDLRKQISFLSRDIS